MTKKIIIGIAIFLSFINSYAQNNTIDTASFYTGGNCGMCKHRIEQANAKNKGVFSTKWNASSKETTVIFDNQQITLDKIHQTIANTGHDTKLHKADLGVYQTLPGCCQYRPEKIKETQNPNNFKDKPFTYLIKGTVKGLEENDKLVPLAGANVYWLDTYTGVQTDSMGRFKIPHEQNSNTLVVSHLSYSPDTITVMDTKNINVVFNTPLSLEEVSIIKRRKPTEISFFSPLKIEKISSQELLKAACCNLAESFETNPSIDVTFTDAITGTREIQMLGLSGSYTQITSENIPNIRGLATINGLAYIPGTWIESIQLGKGSGSVVNGFESIAGQINVELEKPENVKPFFANFYTNQKGRLEVNIHASQSFKKNWASILLLHGAYQGKENDDNNDQFLDRPLGQQLIFSNRWRHKTKHNWVQHFEIKGVLDNKEGGQLDKATTSSSQLWKLKNKTQRLLGSFKMGKVFEEKPFASIGFQLLGIIHSQEETFGLRDYSGKQHSFYFNAIYQSIIDNTQHKIKFGSSLLLDNYKENLSNINYSRREIVAGIFSEYNFSPSEKFSLIAGLRLDYHNQYKTLITPRLHLKYQLSENTVFRASAGIGHKTSNIFAENKKILASSRQIIIEKKNDKFPYGLNMEKAWNFGANFSQRFQIGGKDLVFSLDAYRTTFKNQIVVDFDQNPQSVYFYNLKGQSFANSLQAQVDYEIIKNLDIRMAYRLFDVKTTYQDKLREKPLIAKHRGFVNVGYKTLNGWAFDVTTQWQGNKRIPDTQSNPVKYQLSDISPSYFLTNTQISKKWKNNFTIYAGVENLFSYKQQNAILAYDDPFSSYFDSSLIWGPISGANTYAGLRYTFFKTTKKA